MPSRRFLFIYSRGRTVGEIVVCSSTIAISLFFFFFFFLFFPPRNSALFPMRPYPLLINEYYQRPLVLYVSPVEEANRLGWGLEARPVAISKCHIHCPSSEAACRPDNIYYEAVFPVHSPFPVSADAAISSVAQGP
jgi:hypothetical protein